MINWPLAAADHYLQDGHCTGSSTAGQVKDHIGSSCENDDDDESEDVDDKGPTSVIDKSNRSSSILELGGLDGDLGKAWDTPGGSHECRS